MFKLKENSLPKLHIPHFECDKKLDKKLDNFDLSSLLNRYHCLAFIGAAGSGKTSIAISFLTSRDLFKGVFTKILLCMPLTSRHSLKDNPLESLPPEQLFDELTDESLARMQDIASNEVAENGQTLIIFDDVQHALKIDSIERELIRINSNRRHNRTCLWFCVQNYIKLPKSLRQGLTNIFFFSISKSDLGSLHKELVTIPQDQFDYVMEYFKTYKKNEENKHSFLFWDKETNRLFLNWDEIQFHNTIKLIE